MVFSPQILGFAQSTSSRHGLALATIALTALLALAGCGQKGPLFLPASTVVPASNVTVPQSAVVAPLIPASAAR
ncbi:MAG: lipoprotein [Pseudomonadota bacterium]